MRWLCFYFGPSCCIFPQISVHWSTGHLHRAHYSEIFTTRQLPLLFASLIRPRDAQCEWIITFVYSRTNLPCYVVFAALRMPSWVKCLLWSKMFVRWRQVWCKHGDFRLSCAHPLDSALNQRVNARVLRHRRDSIGKYTATAHGSMTSTLTGWGSTLQSAFDLGVCTDSHRNRSCVV